MKVFGVILGLIMASACSGDPGGPEASDSSDGAAVAAVGATTATSSFTSSFDVLRGHRDHARILAVRRALGLGANRLAALQADITGDNARNGLDDTDPDDGGWDFTLPASATAHTTANSPTNLFGETGIGAWAAVDTGSAGNRGLVTALDAGTGIRLNPAISSPPDAAFGVLLAELADDPGFALVARQHYDARLAANGGASGFGTKIRDARHASKEDGLIAYDLGWLTLSATALDAVFPGAGYAADAATFAGIVVDDLDSAQPRFTIDDPTAGFYVIGLAWSQVAAAEVGDRALFQRVRTKLLGQQHRDGAWPTSATEPADDIQSTALALETLAITEGATAGSLVAEQRATRFLLRGQAASGGWPDATSTELPLVDAEVMLGLALSHSDIAEEDPDSPFAFAAAFSPRVGQVAHAQPQL